MPQNDLLNKTLLILFTFPLPFLLLLFSYKLVFAFYPIIALPTPHQQNTLDFLQGRIEVTALTVPYNEQELAHLDDVQQVMQWADAVVVILLLATLALLYHSRVDWKRYLRRGGITTVAIVSFIILFLLLSFNTAFTIFHLLFFPQGNWIFPADSLLIQTFPLAFFVRMGMSIFGVALGMGILMMYLPTLAEKAFARIQEKL